MQPRFSALGQDEAFAAMPMAPITVTIFMIVRELVRNGCYVRPRSVGGGSLTMSYPCTSIIRSPPLWKCTSRYGGCVTEPAGASKVRSGAGITGVDEPYPPVSYDRKVLLNDYS